MTKPAHTEEIKGRGYHGYEIKHEAGENAKERYPYYAQHNSVGCSTDFCRGVIEAVSGRE